MGSTSRRTSTVSGRASAEILAGVEWHTGLTVALLLCFADPIVLATRQPSVPQISRHTATTLSECKMLYEHPYRYVYSTMRWEHGAHGSISSDSIEDLGGTLPVRSIELPLREDRSQLQQLSADTYCARVGKCKSWWMRTTRQPRAGASR